MINDIKFDPFPFLEDPHQQTILSSMINVYSDPVSECKMISLKDGDKLTVEVTTPEQWKQTDLTVIMVHGLCGSHQSPYLIRMARRLEERIIRVVRMNLRGCGSGRGLAKWMYHAGRSEDVFEVVKQLKLETPESPFILIGFSLGGALVMKMVGELTVLAKDFLVQAIAVNSPIDLHSSVEMIGKPENAIYENYFVKFLTDEVHYRHRKFKDLPRVRLPRNLKMYEFDQLYTAPYYGFKDAHDYYDKCSAINLLSEIEIPCKILFSKDDPIVCSTTIESLDLPKHLEVFRTEKGGHMGYLGNPHSEKGLYWLDSVLLDWIIPKQPEESG